MTEPLSQETKDTLDQMCQGVRDACLTAVLMELADQRESWNGIDNHYGQGRRDAVDYVKQLIIQRFEEMKK